MLPQRNKRSKGKGGEELAKKILQKEGYRIIATNFYSRFGEIDIIALHEDTLVFVEVKARTSDRFGTPLEAVTRQKLDKIRKTAQYFSLLNPNYPKKLRIDVIGISLKPGTSPSWKIVSVY